MPRQLICIDGNEAAGYVAYKTNEVIAIYPITPSSNMGELADEYAAQGKKNIWGTVPLVYEMQSEGGAAGAIHGSLQTGALSTTFTASQGLLLMIPNMFKIAGELTSTVFHVAARTIATQAISIYGDHSDVMTTRSCGWAMMCSNNPQEVMDFALIAQASTLKARVPFLHFFDGFRTSHEVAKIEQLSDEDIKTLIDDELVRAHRARGLAPEKDQLRGILMNPDTFFQARESVNQYYLATPEIIQENMDKLAAQTGRKYRLFDYVGAADAERVVILMGSGCGAVEEAVNALVAKGEKVGMVKVRLFRPFSAKHLLAAIPATAKKIAVLDRTKEPGSQGEPLYGDVMAAISEATMDGSSPFAATPRVVGGRYGLGGKEFTPAMAKGVLDELKNEKPLNHFSVGIEDDVTHLSVAYDPEFDTESPEVVRALFWGLGADGTVGANKNSIKIIGEETDFHAQGFFCYDSKKSGSYTVSHLRFGPKKIDSTYLISKASFVAVHQWVFLEKYPVLAAAGEGATVLLNSPYGPQEVWNHIPKQLQEILVGKKLKLYVIDAYKVARETGMGGRINTIMQTCFFAISGVLPREEAIAQIKKAIKKTYGKRGDAIVEKNYAAVDATLADLYQVEVPSAITGADLPPTISPKAPEFLQDVTAEILAGRGDQLPVSAIPADGTWPRGTTKWEKRNIAQEVPVWDNDLCIQCGKCVLVCPHAAIRSAIVDPAALTNAPEGFLSAKASWKEFADKQYTLQVAVEDCTGCALCVEVCPAKSKTDPSHKAINMEPQLPIREKGAKNWEYFLGLKDTTPADFISFSNVKNVQLAEPLFEFSGACSGCGETPYVKLATQLFGDRMMVANATGCSSVYGGSLPTTPWAQNDCGRGPAWSNSLFEDNAEFGLGMRLSIDKQTEQARELVQALAGTIGETLASELLNADQSTDKGINAQRARVDALKAKLEGLKIAGAQDLLSLADNLVKRSVWIMGGDGWAYDIGYGGLDHVIASGKNVNILVLDTEVYSNTGGQASKATPRGAVARFAAGGKAKGKKDLGQIAMTYGDVYVAQVAMGASDAQTMKAFMEADAYPGVSIIIAYSHCVAHGISDMSQGLNQQKLATECGHWPLYRFNPMLTLEGKNPLTLDSKAPKIAVKEYAYGETRYKMLEKANPEVAARLMEEANEEAQARWKKLEGLAKGVYAPEAK
ncbi:MAG TPA: pyruvate:ferredoxin (flavodoxin) oxidoreductase [Symbiobacteriaceae bacterium]|nr:pyruvate:ferredoxin (flavodoxin) oxidoreductase [Symbiobacteriaceae bacterium]